MENGDLSSGSEDEQTVARVLVDLVWEKLLDELELGLVLEGSGEETFFVGGFAGTAKVLRVGRAYQQVRVGIGAKWQSARSSYVLRSYQYDRTRSFFRPLTEVELAKRDVSNGLDTVSRELRPFIEVTVEGVEG